MSRKNRTYSPEEYFIPKDNRPPVIHIPGREEDMVEIPGEKDVTVLETEGGEIASSQEFFGLFKKKPKPKEISPEIDEKIRKKTLNRPNRSLKEELALYDAQGNDVKKASDKQSTYWKNTFKYTVKNPPKDLVELTTNYDVSGYYSLNDIPMDLLEDMEDPSDFYEIFGLSEYDEPSRERLKAGEELKKFKYLVLVFTGPSNEFSIHITDKGLIYVDHEDLDIDPFITSTPILDLIADYNKYGEYRDMVENYKKGKVNLESIQDKFMVTLGIESVDDAMDTPLVIKGSDETDDKMTADDLTTDPNKVEELKEEFGDPSDKTDDADTGDSGSTDETPDSETEENDTSEDTSGSKENVDESSDDTENKEKEDNEDSKDKEDKEEKDNDDSKDAAENTDDNTEEK